MLQHGWTLKHCAEQKMPVTKDHKSYDLHEMSVTGKSTKMESGLRFPVRRGQRKQGVIANGQESLFGAMKIFYNQILVIVA